MVKDEKFVKWFSLGYKNYKSLAVMKWLKELHISAERNTL